MTQDYRARLRTQLATASRVTASEAKNQFGRVLEIALSDGAVVITKHDEPKAILLSIKEYEAMPTKSAGSSNQTAPSADARRESPAKSRKTMGMFASFDAPAVDELRAARQEISASVLASVRRRR